MRALALALAALCLPTSALAQSWAPSKYGQDDTLGAVNNLSAAGVLAAAKLVTTGKTYSLGITVGPDTPAYGTRSSQIFTVPSVVGPPLGSNKAVATDDFLATWTGIGSQLDGLGHLGIDYVYYNGNKQDDFLRPNGLIKLSVDRIPPIVARGVLIDVVGLKGGVVPPSTVVNKAEIEAAIQKQGIAAIGKGDVVILHTGWLASMASRDKKTFLEKEPGLGKAGAEYLASLGVVAVGSDSWAVEVIPSEDPGEVFPCHQILLAKNGVHILENMNSGPLAADKVYEFLFVLGQPKFQGAVQANINPIAID